MNREQLQYFYPGNGSQGYPLEAPRGIAFGILFSAVIWLLAGAVVWAVWHG